jgi:glutathione synthase
VIRQTLTQLLTTASLDEQTKDLIITDPLTNTSHKISVVYFRSAYTPTDLPTQKHWDMRTLIEKSRAIKCPTLALQLAGGKRVQEILTRPGMLARFLPEVLSEDLKELRETWMGMWALDIEDINGNSGVEEARLRHKNLVIKPQREGGGNNIYRDSIPSFLDRLDEHDRKAWIAMEMIEPPEVEGLMVKAGTGEVVRGPVISELGIFGWVLFEGDKRATEVKQGEDVGWLVRTKGTESNEGGVAVGFSVLDSLLLVD